MRKKVQKPAQIYLLNYHFSRFCLMLKYIKSGNTDKIIATTLHLSDICIKMIPKQFPKDYEVLTNFTELGTEENAELETILRR